jgi:two-component system, LytTR family, response regulator
MIQVFIPTDRGIRIIQVSNIVRIEACSNYSKVYFDNANPLTVAKVLHWFEDRLGDGPFYRIHKTHIVNRLFISTISFDDSVLTLKNGEQIKISRRRKVNLKRMLA